jgi:hypothetical protein
MDAQKKKSNVVFLDDSPGYYGGLLEAAEIVCCTLQGDSCSRKVKEVNCRSGDKDDFKVTWKVASDHCKTSGMRLCKSQEELNQCCGAGCGYDDQLVWSSLKDGGMPYIILFYA